MCQNAVCESINRMSNLAMQSKALSSPRSILECGPKADTYSTDPTSPNIGTKLVGDLVILEKFHPLLQNDPII